MVGRGEDAGFPKCYHHFLLFPKYYHQFLLLPQCFQKDFTCRSSKVLFVRLRVNPIPRNPELEKVFKNNEGKGKNETEEKLNLYELLVVLGFNATLTAKVISWRSMTHMCFLAFSHQYLRNFSFQSHQLLFPRASAEVRGENTPERKVASTGD